MSSSDQKVTKALINALKWNRTTDKKD